MRLIRLAGAQPSGYGRILLSPDGAQAYVIDDQAETLTPLDTETGVLGKPVPEIRDGVLSPDGAALYALGPWGLRMVNLAALLAGSAQPVWEVAAARFERLALNGDRVLVSVLGPERQLLVFDAVTGREVASATLADYPEGLAAGPDGGWAVRVSGDRSEGAALRPRSQAARVGDGALRHGALLRRGRRRYIVSGQMPGGDGSTAIRALREDDLSEVTHRRLAVMGCARRVRDVTAMACWGSNRYGPARLYDAGTGVGCDAGTSSPV